ncbi:MAG: SDR family NAD(P)-dependent oxidoreductase [Bradymonadia bacterium]
MNTPPERPVALVTGASRGIGAAIAAALCAEGYAVAWAARSIDALRDLVAEHGGLAVALDVTDDDAMTRALDEVREALGPIDVLVNNAGIAHSATIARTDDELWAQTLAVNLTAPFKLTRACMPHMLTQKWGRVVFIASNAGLSGYRFTSAYCASKHGVIGLTRALAVEVAGKGITVNAVCPGFVDTPMTEQTVARIQAITGRDAESARKALESLNPQRRLIEIDEVVHSTLALLPHGARGINGQTVVVDGGQVQH